MEGHGAERLVPHGDTAVGRQARFGKTAQVVLLAQIGPGVDARPVFVAERAALLELLGDLRGEEWAAPTACPGWTVRDVAAHLLHDDLRRLSSTRDRHVGGPSPADGQTLVEFLNGANQRWVVETGFLSPRLLVDLLTHTGRLLQVMWAQAELAVPGERVSWAGLDPAPVWLDLARDFTEDWVHQQQIRDATGRDGLTDREFLDPVLDILLRALPHTYRHVPATAGASVLVLLHDAGRELAWALHAEPALAGWTLRRDRLPDPTAQVNMAAETLWRLATGGISSAAAARATRFEGDAQLAQPLLGIVSVVR